MIRQKRWNIGIRLIPSALGIVFACLAAVAYPKLTNDGYLIVPDCGADLGNYPSGVRIEHSFQIWNLSFRSATIRQMVTSCTCTVASMDKLTIAPFSECSAKLSIDTSREFSGRRTRGVTIFTKDGRQISEMVTFVVNNEN